MKTLKYLFLIIILSCYSSIVFSQVEDTPYCEDDESPAIFNVVYKTPQQGQYLKVLIIYINFPDDDLAGPEPPENIWEAPINGATKPMNYYHQDGRMIDPEEESNSVPFMERYSPYTYSDWFCQMSMGEFDFVGDEVAVVLPEESTYYQTNHVGYGTISQEAVYLADELGVDFSEYDNWNNSTNEWGSDGIVDFILIQYRRVPNNDNSWFYFDSGVGGSTSINFYINDIDGVAISKGAWGISKLYNTTRTQIVLEHEFCHYIFGNYFNHYGMNSNHVSMGMMTPGHGGSTYTMTPMERSMPGLYSTPIEVSSQNAPSGSITLDDFISTGQCIKIAIPNTDPQEYFWVSNHQKISPYDGVSRGSNECWLINKYLQDPYCDVGKGLYIYRQSDKFCSNSQNGDFYFAFDLMNADGRHNWELDREVNDPFLGSFGIQKTIGGSRNWGMSEFNKHYLHSSWSAQLITDDPCSDQTNDYSITGDFHGDGLDAYNIGYEEIFSPYSNPASNSCQSPNTNTGVTIKVHSQNQQTGAITLYVYFDDELALADFPPSKPKNVKVGKDYIDTNEGSFHPKITWDENIEPDFVDPGEGDPRYKVYRGISSVCENEPNYSFIAYAYTNEYIDEYSILYDKQDGSGACTYQFRAYSYKISAIDNTDMESLKSEKGMVTGYINPCAPQWAPGNNVTLEYNPVKPESFAIKNFPNPFNPVTNIQFDLPHDVFVTIKIYDITGREISTLVNEYREAGYYITSFDGSRLSSGVYYYKIIAGDYEAVRKMILLK